jgi:hypothetical protein
MKTFHEILAEGRKSTKTKKFSLEQINIALLKAGLGPAVIMKAMNALNLARGLGLVEREKE